MLMIPNKNPVSIVAFSLIMPYVPAADLSVEMFTNTKLDVSGICHALSVEYIWCFVFVVFVVLSATRYSPNLWIAFPLTSVIPGALNRLSTRCVWDKHFSKWLRNWG